MSVMLFWVVDGIFRDELILRMCTVESELGACCIVLCLGDELLLYFTRDPLNDA